MAKVLDRDAYDRYLNSPAWAARRELAFNRYGRACQACETTEALHVHHVTYDRFGAEELEDLRVLCAEHHDLAHHLERAGGYELRAATDLVISAYTNHVASPVARVERTHQRPAVVDWRQEVTLPGLGPRTSTRGKPATLLQKFERGTPAERKLARRLSVTLRRHRPIRRTVGEECAKCLAPFPCPPWQLAVAELRAGPLPT